MILTHDPFIPTPNSQYSKNDKQKNNPKYFKDMVEYADVIIGRIIKKIKQLNLMDNTLIMFIGDNGTHKGIISQMNNYTIQGAKVKPLLLAHMSQ